MIIVSRLSAAVVSSPATIGSSVIHSRTRASLECTRPASGTEDVALGQDADQASAVEHDSGADALVRHALRGLSERVLGSDREQVA